VISVIRAYSIFDLVVIAFISSSVGSYVEV
ncbi:unnamed protein product, partial [Adineta steineri]